MALVVEARFVAGVIAVAATFRCFLYQPGGPWPQEEGVIDPLRFG